VPVVGNLLGDSGDQTVERRVTGAWRRICDRRGRQFVI
jgi:hypothetical protein